MTVIILARATDGFVVAADSRTCSNDLPRAIDDDMATKVRVYRFGSRGYITASSGRARIAGVTIADVEARFVAEREGMRAIPTPEEFAEYLRAAIEQYNQSQPCNCASQCVFEPLACLDCYDSPNPDCAECHGGQDKVWAAQGHPAEGDCLCSPGEGELSTVPPRYSWCHCSASIEGPLKWLCVPFGPERQNPTTTEITWDNEAPPQLHPIDRYPLVQGELATEYEYSIPVICETLRDAAKFDTNGIDGDIVGLGETIERVRSLLVVAYEEGKHNAALRNGFSSPSEIGLGGRDEVTIEELANALRNEDSDLDATVGVSGIGGDTLFVTGADSGQAREWSEAVASV